MDWPSRRTQLKARLLSYRGRALLWAAATALGLAAVMALAFSAARPDAPNSAPILAERPGPPPITDARRETAAASPRAVTMQPIGCPPEWTKPNVTCWQAR